MPYMVWSHGAESCIHGPMFSFLVWYLFGMFHPFQGIIRCNRGDSTLFIIFQVFIFYVFYVNGVDSALYLFTYKT